MIQLHCGNSLDVLATLGDDSVDSIVTDPPYGLSFMGRKWDYDVPSVDIWVECLRVLKPGGHLLAFAGTRTQHRMCVNIEDAGFEIRDMIAWVYGSGFPKSMDVSKAIDKAAGAKRKVVGRGKKDGGASNGRKSSSVGYVCESNEYDITAPATPEAQQWEGWGTALKPALEPITVARKPFKGTVAANVLEHGTGAINIDVCRVGDSNGRWPANLIHDGSDEVTELFPYTTSGKPSGVRGVSKHNVAYADVAVGSELTGFGDSGSAARFFQQCESDYSITPKSLEAGEKDSVARFKYCAKANKKDREEGNTHPTVKPTALMTYLVRLVTPPGGVVLDPFMGSGSTGKAAVREGFDFIGIEREEEYVAIASKRLQVIQRSILASRSADQNG